MPHRQKKDINELSEVTYMPDVVPGYKRFKRGRGFSYINKKGEPIKTPKKLARFRKLAIPPAWKDVWISPDARGHLQATGIDEKGLKQYIYHEAYVRERQERKMSRIMKFGKTLPEIKLQVKKDIRIRPMNQRKVTAIALKVMEETLIRVGNEQYLKKYSSHGLTTLEKRHLRIDGNSMVFSFAGKKGVNQEITLCDRSIAGMMKKLYGLPGRFLFKYINEEGRILRLCSQDINSYLLQVTGKKFTSKDYRTWYASLWTFRLFAEHSDHESERALKENVLKTLDAVSKRLGNTRAVCKRYYVPDVLIEAYEEGSLWPYLNSSMDKRGKLSEAKGAKQLLAFLMKEWRNRSKPV